LNEELTASFHNITPLEYGQMQTVTGQDGRTYISFYTRSLLDSCGYNNPEITRTINELIQAHSGSASPLNIDALIADIQTSLKAGLPKNLSRCFFNTSSFEAVLAQSLLTAKKDQILCLEAPSAPSRSDAFIAINDQSDLTDFDALKDFLKDHKHRTAAFLLDPYLKGKGRLATREEIHALCQSISKAGVPLIWSDSSVGLGRCGTLFSFEHYDVKPDMVIFSAPLFGGRAVHFAAANRKLGKALDAQNLSLLPADAPNLVIFKVILDYFEEQNLLKSITALGVRFLGKTRALAASYGEAFRFHGSGLCLFLDLRSPKAAREFAAFMLQKGLLLRVSEARPSVITLFTPFILTDADADAFIEAMNQYLELN
jgi:alanine-glyoxylate transaminase/(R)-3-amino-2-methylpropionate-pyruvate transaminase